MLVTARTVGDYEIFTTFFKKNCVEIHLSQDLIFIGRLGANKDLIGAVAYNAFSGRTCSMHVVGVDNWLSRELLRAAFEYPFITSNMVQLFAPVRGSNERALKFIRHIGFSVLTRIRSGWDDKTDIIILGMHKSQCRWLSKEMHHVKGQLTSAA